MGTRDRQSLPCEWTPVKRGLPPSLTQHGAEPAVTPLGNRYAPLTCQELGVQMPATPPNATPAGAVSARTRSAASAGMVGCLGGTDDTAASVPAVAPVAAAVAEGAPRTEPHLPAALAAVAPLTKAPRPAAAGGSNSNPKRAKPSGGPDEEAQRAMRAVFESTAVKQMVAELSPEDAVTWATHCEDHGVLVDDPGNGQYLLDAVLKLVAAHNRADVLARWMPESIKVVPSADQSGGLRLALLVEWRTPDDRQTFLFRQTSRLSMLLQGPQGPATLAGPAMRKETLLILPLTYTQSFIGCSASTLLRSGVVVIRGGVLVHVSIAGRGVGLGEAVLSHLHGSRELGPYSAYAGRTLFAFQAGEPKLRVRFAKPSPTEDEIVQEARSLPLYVPVPDADAKAPAAVAVDGVLPDGTHLVVFLKSERLPEAEKQYCGAKLTSGRRCRLWHRRQLCTNRERVAPAPAAPQTAKQAAAPAADATR